MMSVIVPLMVFCVLVFVHELGHFLFAKWNKVGVFEFAIGFGPLIFSKQWGETRYSLRLIPLGGYVKMVGEDPRALDATEEEMAELSPQEQLLIRDRSKWFSLKGLWARSAIVFAGPLFNFIFAWMVGVLSFAIYGQVYPVTEPVIGDLLPGQPAATAGLIEKDRVESINGVAVSSWDDLASRIRKSGGVTLTLKVTRVIDGKPQQIDIVVKGSNERSEIDYLRGRAEGDQDYRIGILPDLVRQPVGFKDAVVNGSLQTVGITVMTAKGIWGMLVGSISTKNIAGPIFIFSEADRSAKRGLEHLMDFMIMLSIGLAVLNLLPVPVLDGGHLVFFALEALRGKPVGIRARELATQVGVFLLLLLMMFAVSNDIFRHLG